MQSLRCNIPGYSRYHNDGCYFSKLWRKMHMVQDMTHPIIKLQIGYKRCKRNKPAITTRVSQKPIVRTIGRTGVLII